MEIKKLLEVIFLSNSYEIKKLPKTRSKKAKNCWLVKIEASAVFKILPIKIISKKVKIGPKPPTAETTLETSYFLNPL